MGALAGLVSAIESARSAEELTCRVLDRADTVLGCDHIGLYRIDLDTGRPAEIHVRHLPESFVVKYEQLGREADRVLARVLATRRAVIDEEAFGRDGWRRSVLYRHLGPSYKVRHYLCAPILVGGTVVGTLNIGRSSDEARFDARARARTEAVARTIATRLGDLAASPEARDASLQHLGRLRAERALLRTRLDLVEDRARLLPAADAAAAWRALARNEATPVDTFDLGDRRYVLIAAQPPAAPAARLTDREREILACAAAGASNKVIAADLGLAASTVATHLMTARAKLGLRSRVRLVIEARRRARRPRGE